MLKPTIESVADNMGDAHIQAAKVTADSGFHSQETVAYCFKENIDAYVADGNFRIRDPGLRIGIAINQKPSCRKTLRLQKLK